METLVNLELIGLMGLLLLLVFFAIGLFQIVYYVVLEGWRRRVRLPDPCGFCAFSVRQGEPLVLRLHSTAPLTVELFRLGATQEAKGAPLSVPPCPQSNLYDYARGFDWQPALSIATDELRPGFHFARVSHRDQPDRAFHIPFIVRKARARVALVASTNTWQTYNDFAGLSNYTFQAMPLPMRAIITLATRNRLEMRVSDRWTLSAIPIPWNRPMINLDVDIANIGAGLNGRISTFMRGEWALVRLLEKLGTDYTIISDHDFARGEDRLAGADTLIFNTHSEYWSNEMIGRVAEAIQRGHRLAFLSGNNIYRRIDFTKHGHYVVEQATNGETVAALIGTSYDPSGYHTYSPFRLIESGHWLFAGLDLEPGSIFGAAPEFDPGWTGGGLPSVIASAASGYETDKLRATSGSYVILAVGTNAEGPAYMVHRDTPGGGWVFNCSSVSFTSLIGQDPVVDAIVGRLVAEPTPAPAAISAPEGR